MTGTAERAYGIQFDYISYLVLHAPVLGLLKGAVITGCLAWLFPASPRRIEAAAPVGRMTPAEWRISAILLVTLAFWMTDTLHGIRPAWVGLVSACLCLLPRIGFLNGEEFSAGVNVRTCIYLGGILGLAAVVAWSGLGAAIGDAIIPLLPLSPEHPAADLAAMTGLASLLNFVVTANGVPAVFTPLASSLASHTGLSLAAVLMSQVFAYGTPLLPYQAAPIVVAAGMARVPAAAAVKLCLLVGLISFVVLAPLDIAWFRALGWIG
jgi:hypothetical protein